MREEKCESELAGKILKKQPIFGREIKGPKSDEQKMSKLKSQDPYFFMNDEIV